jgi:YesN/AraC family two-component response regulator
MEAARQMLLETEKSVGEIGDSIGYCNRGHFSQLYQRYFGKITFGRKNIKQNFANVKELLS